MTVCTVKLLRPLPLLFGLLTAGALSGGEGGAFFIDLSAACNMGFRDEIADDRAGGWTDQGGNDFRSMPTGDRTLCGVPFRIVDPAANGGKSCIVLRGAGRDYFPESAKVAVGRKGAAIVFLHTLAWGDEQPVAHYLVRYADGKTEDIPIRQGQEILGWWGANETEKVKIAVLSKNLATRKVCVHAWQWVNPRPDVVIESVEFRSTGSNGIPIVVAATLLDQPVTLKSEYTPPKLDLAGFNLIEAENFTSFNVPPGDKDKDTGKPFYKTWPNPLFSGGHLFEIKPGETLAEQDPSIPKPDWLKENCLKLTYEFTADKTAKYTLWVRLGPANVYSPFRWRIDEGEWGQVGRQDPFLDMWDISFWVTLGWVRMGERQIEAGKHTLHIEVPRPKTEAQAAAEAQIEKTLDTEDEAAAQQKASEHGTKKDDKNKEETRWFVMADCFVVSRIPFHPNGTLKPGEKINRIAWLDEPARNALLDFTSEKIASNGEREVFKLDGLWEMARDQEPIPSPDQNDDKRLRGPLLTLPDPESLAWMGVNVPHVEDRPETSMLHRRWYRKFVSLPKDLKGKRVSIHFSEANYTASIFVNGKLCGTHTGGYVPFAVDISDALAPGNETEIMVGVKGLAYYRKDYLPEAPWGMGTLFYRQMLVPGRTGWNKDTRDGLPGSVWLETHGQVFGHDLFVQSKYAEQRLSTSVEVDNKSATAFSGKVRFSVFEPDRRELVCVVGETAFSLAAGHTTLVQVTGSAEKLAPWWPGKGKVYVIRAEIVSDRGQVVDASEDRFGFREVQLKDKSFFINGKRFNFRSVLTGGKETLEETRAQAEEFHCNNLRLPHTGWDCFFPKDCQKSSLRFMDEHGLTVRFESQINGMVIDLATGDERFWQYATDYFKQFVKAYRNHPSIIVWVAENELDLISNMGNDRTFKKREWEMMRTAHEIDPTRPVMGDGAGDLLGECEICNWHYCEVGPIVDPNNMAAMQEQAARGVSAIYPDNAFTFASVAGPCAARPWDRKRPLWIGETYFYSGPITWQAWIGGDEALSGRFAADAASVKFVNMLVRGYRWQDVAGIDMFVHADRLPGREIKNSLAPIAVFSRDYGKNQYAGAQFTRRLKILNDTLDASPIHFAWRLVSDGKTLDSGESDHTIQPGFNEDKLLTVRTPPDVADRAEAALEFRLSRHGKTVFEESHPISIFDRTINLRQPPGMGVSIYDPGGKLAPALTQWGLKVRPIEDLGELTDGLLIVGPRAFGETIKNDLQRIEAFVKKGGRVLILEQDRPYPERSLPFPVAMSPAEGSTAYPRGAHPALEGIGRDDLSIWGKAQAVFRRPFVRSDKWPLIVDASTKNGLDLAPVIETSWGKGHYVLSQMLIGPNLGIDPMAERLLAGLIRYLMTLPRTPARLASFLGKDTLDGRSLAGSGFTFQHHSLGESDVELCLGGSDVVVLPGSVRALAELRGARKALEELTYRGGWVLVQGLAPDAVGELSKIVGEEIILRPVGQERIVVTDRSDRLLIGIGNEDLYWDRKMKEEDARKLCFLFGDMPLREGVFPHAVVYDDVCGLTGDSRLYNGLTSEDHWQYISYRGDDPVRLDWQRPFDIHKVVVRVNFHYKRIEEITLILGDDKEHPLTRPVPKDRPPIVFEFEPRKIRSLSLQATKFKVLNPGPMGWDTVEIYRVLPDSFRQRVVPLTRPAGIVKFPMGKGGILLNMTAMSDVKGDRVLMQLLHNLGAGRSKAGGPVEGTGSFPTLEGTATEEE